MLDDQLDDAAFDALWSRAVEEWGDEARHSAVLEYAVARHLLPELAGRYRSLVDDVVRGPTARRKLDGVVAAATLMLEATKTPKPGKVPLPITLTAFAICALLLGWIALALAGKP